MVPLLLFAGRAAGIATRVREPLHPSGPIAVGSLAVMPVTKEAGSEGFRPEVRSELVADLVRSLVTRIPLAQPARVHEKGE